MELLDSIKEETLTVKINPQTMEYTMDIQYGHVYIIYQVLREIANRMENGEIFNSAQFINNEGNTVEADEPIKEIQKIKQFLDKHFADKDN